MPAAIFVVPFPPEQSLVMEDLYYTENGELKGGYSVIGHVPSVDTCACVVWASETTLDTLAEKYLYLGEYADETPKAN